MKGLYERGYSREDVLELFRFIDWMMRLPEDLATGFYREVEQYEEAEKMPYVTSVERLGMRRGIQQGVIENLRSRFGEVPEAVQDGIHSVNNVDALWELHRQALAVESLDQFRALLADAQTHNPA